MQVVTESRAEKRDRSIGSWTKYLSDEHRPSISDERPFLHIERCSYAVSMSELNSFGARLEARMKERGWSMPRLGKGLKAKKGGILDGDIGRAAVFGWINGAGFPNVIQLAEICRRLDISADYLIFGVAAVSPKVEAAKSAIRQLSPEELQELHGLLNSTPVDDATVERRMPVTAKPPSPSHEQVRPKEVERESPTGVKLEAANTVTGKYNNDIRSWLIKEKDEQSGPGDSSIPATQPKPKRTKGS